jgi:glutathione S-transferase
MHFLSNANSITKFCTVMTKTTGMPPPFFQLVFFICPLNIFKNKMAASIDLQQTGDTSTTDVIRIVHIPRFRSTRPVWMYHELKLLYGDRIPPLDITTFADIPSFRVNKPQWLIDMNPNGKVPTMAHGPIIMFEGGAICSYMLDRFDVDRVLLPKDPEAVANYYLMVSWCASTLDNLTATSSPINIVLDKSNPLRPMDDVEVNQKYFNEVSAPYITKLLQKSGGPYLCGKSFTAADIIVGFSLMIAQEKMKPTWLEEHNHPEICAYIRSFRNRPALKISIGEEI